MGDVDGRTLLITLRASETDRPLLEYETKSAVSHLALFLDIDRCILICEGNGNKASNSMTFNVHCCQTLLAALVTSQVFRCTLSFTDFLLPW